MRRFIVTAAVAGSFAAVPASSALAATPERASDPFVCPVLSISEQAAAHVDRFHQIGDGQYTFAPGSAGDPATFNGNVPNHATNADGAGSPGGAHAAPGDPSYTAIWSGNS
jgi:hypothetical protein